MYFVRIGNIFCNAKATNLAILRWNTAHRYLYGARKFSSNFGERFRDPAKSLGYESRSLERSRWVDFRSLGCWDRGRILKRLLQSVSGCNWSWDIGLFASLALPQTIETMLARTSKDDRSGDRSGDRSTLYLGGVLGFFSYVTMTLVMTAVPLEAQRQGLSSSEISGLSQLHMVAMYLPILVVPYFINQFSAQKVAIWSLGLGGLSAVCAELLLKDEKANNLELAILMGIAGVFWAFSFTAASNIVAVNQYGRTHLVARGRAESMPPLGMIIGSILAGALLGSVGFIWVVVFFGIVSLSAFLLLTILTSLKPT